MTEGTVIRVLRYVRAEIIRDELDGLEHVEALLRARGVDPDTLYVPRKVPKRFRRGELGNAILRTLRDGPRPGSEIVREFAASTNRLTPAEAYSRVYRALHRMRGQGLVRAAKDRAGRYVWGLAP